MHPFCRISNPHITRAKQTTPGKALGYKGTHDGYSSQAVIKLAASLINSKGRQMATGLWTKEQVKLAFHLYCQLPYGRIYGRNPEIIALAKIIGRTADAVAMKMLNIASIDPAVTGAGKAGLGNAFSLDRVVWDEFHSAGNGLHWNAIS